MVKQRPSKSYYAGSIPVEYIKFEMAEWLRRRPVKSLWKHVVVQFLLSTNKKLFKMFYQQIFK